LVEDQKRVQMQASGLQMTEALQNELKAVIEKHGGTLELVGHPTTTLEDLFLRVIEESKARPGRRYMQAEEPKA
jgi:ABC-2 type transport system ATP-binding protein